MAATGVLSHMTDSESDNDPDISKQVEEYITNNDQGSGGQYEIHIPLSQIEEMSERLERLEFLAERVEQLEQSFVKLQKQSKEGTYVNWRSYHDLIRHFCFVSTIELEDMLWRMQVMSIESTKDRNHMRKMLNSIKIHKVNRTTRFPSDEDCVDIKTDTIKKCFEDLYYSLSFKDNIEMTDELYEDKDVKENAAVYFKGAIDNFVKNLANKDGVESMDSFEKSYDLKWLPKY